MLGRSTGVYQILCPAFGRRQTGRISFQSIMSGSGGDFSFPSHCLLASLWFLHFLKEFMTLKTKTALSSSACTGLGIKILGELGKTGQAIEQCASHCRGPRPMPEGLMVGLMFYLLSLPPNCLEDETQHLHFACGVPRELGSCPGWTASPESLLQGLPHTSPAPDNLHY